MTLEIDWRESRRVGTPWCAIATPDYMATILKVMSWEPKLQIPAAIWTCGGGLITPIALNDGTILSLKVKPWADGDAPPATVIKGAISELPKEGILFIVVVDNSFWDSPFTIQAVSDCRDVFKNSGRMIVFLGINPKLPEFLREDVPVFYDPLPTEEELRLMVTGISQAFKVKLDDVTVNRSASMCLGMTMFAAEEAFSRKVRKKENKVDLAGLSLARQAIIEQSTNKAISFEKENWTFDQVGGMESFKDYMYDIYGGPEAPEVTVRVDEIDKCITAASSGQVADNTGVSQDIFRTFLTSLEDNGWMGLLAVGGPGTGKTLGSICTGNEFGSRTLVFDPNACKGSLVGESEAAIRRVMEVIKSIGGRRVLFIATANRLDTLPPELQRRFWLGTYFWDSPTAEERKRIWDIQRQRFNISDKDPIPNDEEWVGSDIRNCCRLAKVCKSTLVKASVRLTLAAVSARSSIEKLRTLAEESGFLSANKPGPYKREKKTNTSTRTLRN